MSMWRIRIALADDHRSYETLRDLLARHRASALRLRARGPDTDAVTGEVVVELSADESLGALLRELHEISPQVFISRADPARPAAIPVPRSRRLPGFREHANLAPQSDTARFRRTGV